jgi:galactose mutarotase-like enzyme
MNTVSAPFSLRKTLIKKYIHKNFEGISFENDLIKIGILPQIGGKMFELKDKRAQQQFLLEPQNESRMYESPTFAKDFSLFDISGFDECFPTIESSDPFPDHGEVWSRPWNFVIHEHSIEMTIRGVNAEYEFGKEIWLDNNSIHIQYSVLNNMDVPFHYLWSAHPLLNIKSGVRLLLPKSVTRVFLNWASNPNMGAYGDFLQWPITITHHNELVDLSVAAEQNKNVAVKCFTDVLEEGFAGLYYPETDRTLFFEFDPADVPYVGLWLCYGGWPVASSKKQFTLAIEPCNGRPDKLQNAIQRNECQVLAPHTTKAWNLTISVYEGMKTTTHS